jgi:chemotaxis protein MotB
MARKKKAHVEEAEKDNSERWLLTYSDLITLLMIFFVLLYSMGRTDTAKMQEVATAFEQVFSQANLGLWEGTSTGSKGMLEGGRTKAVIASRSKKEEILRKADDLLKNLIRGNQLMIGSTSDGVKITMFSDVFFKSQSSELSYEAGPALGQVAEMLNGIENNIRIEGNTDNLPNSGADQSDQNWDLSALRAINVLKYLQMIGVNGSRMTALANGSAHPTKSNDTPEGRAYNRRVDIVILF